MATVQLPAPPLLTNTGIPVELRRNASLTDVEKFFLRALLVDTNSASETTPQTLQQKQQQQHEPKAPLDCIGDTPSNKLTRTHRTPKTLDDNVLFQLPFTGAPGNPVSGRKFGRHEKKILGLWQAHEGGVYPAIMHHRKKSSGIPPLSKIQEDGPKRHHRKKSSSIPDVLLLDDGTHPLKRHSRKKSSNVPDAAKTSAPGAGFDDAQSRASSLPAETIRTDLEVRPQRNHHDDDSSWGEEDGGFVHYDAWEVLNDEYAEDFGFDYNETIHSIKATLSGDECHNVFKILGTSADDQAAQPHVLSPPLMDSILNFVPEALSMENYWMKFSLIRDGCSLYTLKQYVKASPYTLLAIETTRGDVFGAFTSHIWRNHATFYGNALSFLWRMRHNRRTPCHSLFEQAQMESEIDYYPYSGLNDLVQVCDDDRLAIGGGKLDPDANIDGRGTAQGVDVASLKEGEGFGFGICLDEDLLSGTTSPCGTFRNPCLINSMSKGEVFEIANLEMWAFTPCSDVKSAEKMEMTRFFVEESLRTVSTCTSSSASNDIFSNQFNNQEQFQRDFYRRIGYNEPTRHQRNGSFQFGQINGPSCHR